jgi:uracil-DNA glycosylase
VRCVPPENKPVGEEIRQCRDFLKATIAEMPNLAAILALGRIAHDSTVVALGARPSGLAFGHGAVHAVGALTLFASYHCSRYNTNTGVLTADMFCRIFAAVRRYLDAESQATTAPALSLGGKTG